MILFFSRYDANVPQQPMDSKNHHEDCDHRRRPLRIFKQILGRLLTLAVRIAVGKIDARLVVKGSEVQTRDDHCCTIASRS